VTALTCALVVVLGGVALSSTSRSRRTSIADPDDSSHVLGDGATILDVVIVDVDVFVGAKALRSAATFDVASIARCHGGGPMMMLLDRHGVTRVEVDEGVNVYVPLRGRQRQRVSSRSTIASTPDPRW
jgi:hypothetical protein